MASHANKQVIFTLFGPFFRLARENISPSCGSPGGFNRKTAGQTTLLYMPLPS
jgi:hypothetical protein